MAPQACTLRGVERAERQKAWLLSAWFFVTMATLWLLKPLRVASLLAHLGAAETPYVQLASVAAIAVIVALYSRVIGRASRIQVVRSAYAACAFVFVLFWVAVRFGGPAITAHRPFVWSVYVLVEIYAAVMIGIFWTYTNDIVTPAEADRSYSIIGLGGILGGIAGGVVVDVFARRIGTPNFLLVCVALSACAAGIATSCDATFRPVDRAEPPGRPLAATALDGASEVLHSPYLALLTTIVVAYEVTATFTTFAINAVFEHSHLDELRLARMYGRLGWIVSATALVSQVVLVPSLLPRKRLALLVPPLAMIVAALGVVALPVIATAVALAAADRGLNYSIQEATTESLYVPLPVEQKYKAKAFIDMFVDRAAKALAALILLAIIRLAGVTVRLPVIVSFASTAIWLGAAHRLGVRWLAHPVQAISRPPPQRESAPAEDVRQSRVAVG